MYQNPYFTNYQPSTFNQQSLTERIDNQITQLQQMKEQMKQQNNGQSGGITQNFQLAPTQSGIRYANTLDEVGKEPVLIETPFFSKDFSVLWVKNTKGEIRTFELNEIVPKDEKDIKIDFLMAQIEELKKGMIVSEQSNTNVDEPVAKPTEKQEPTNVSTISKSSKKQKWPQRNS